MQEDLEIINQCTDFLKRSSRRFGSALSRATKDLRRYSGNFWDDEFKKQYRSGKNRQCLSLNNWNVICNAIASPMSASPWHTELKDKTGELKNVQEAIDALEADNDVKNALLDSFRKAVLSGYGFLVVSTDKDELTGEAKITLESVKHLQSVALDPACCSTTGEDAEEGAIVNFISLRKAKRLYGEDVVPMNYPQTRAALDLNDMEQWGCPEDQTAIVSYYVKENEGVHFYKICGDKIVQSDVLPIKFIPIIRIAGNEIYDKEDINYNGIIQLTLNLELGANIAYSTLIERCGRSTKANYLINVDAIDGLEKSYANSDKDDALVVMWKGEHEPKPIVEQFQTGDLQSVITTTRTLMEDVVGVPMTGIPQGTPEPAYSIHRDADGWGRPPLHPRKRPERNHAANEGPPGTDGPRCGMPGRNEGHPRGLLRTHVGRRRGRGHDPQPYRQPPARSPVPRQHRHRPARSAPARTDEGPR